MEIILPSRNKIVAVFPLLLILIIIFDTFIISHNSSIDNDSIGNYVSGVVQRLEDKISERKNFLISRADLCFSKFRATGTNPGLHPGESLVFVKDGGIDDYLGEVFYFKQVDIKTGDYTFLKKESIIYFIKKPEQRTFYINEFSDLEKDFFSIKKDLPFAFYELKFFDAPVKKGENSAYSGINRGNYNFYKNLDSMNNQVFVELKFLISDFKNYLEVQREQTMFGIIFVLAILFFMICRIINSGPLLKTIYFIISWIFFILFVVRSCGFSSINEFLISGIGIWQLLILLLLSLQVALGVKNVNFRKNKISLFLLFISFVLMFSATLIFKVILENLAFPYLNLSLRIPYILLTAFMFTFLSSILLVIGKLKELCQDVSLKIWSTILIILVILFSILNSENLFINIFICLVILSIRIKGKILRIEILRIFLITFIVFFTISSTGNQEKKEFISTGLRDIFSNQNNYAKFISREIIHNFNRRTGDLSIFFDPKTSSEIRNIWRSSVASKENVSSGIYVVDTENRVINSFSYRIPYLDIEIKRKFPFWEIDEYKTDYFGSRVSLAVAYINVYKDLDYLGRIIIQVIDSSDLIVKDRNENSIFMLNKRVDGNNLSYLKLNRENMIVENPSNITLHEITEKSRKAPGWIKFRSMDLTYTGYIFSFHDNKIIIFYPKASLADIFSELIRLFLLFLFLYLIFHLDRIFALEWRQIFRSFSFQVFAILILLSLVTAIVFSLVSIQYNRKSMAQSYRNRIYAADGIAFKIVSDILAKRDTLVQKDLFFISNVLDSDVSIYMGNELFETSNYRKILNSEIPLFVDSEVTGSLYLKNERFIISGNKGKYSSFFKIYNYIVRIDHPFRTGTDILKGKLFLNFIVNLFFILTLFGIFLALIFRRRIIFPIMTLNRKMADVAKGELRRINAIPKEIEIKNLFSGFNSMVRGISEQKKKISEISRMKILVKITRWIAHEIKNPLTPIKLSAQQILKSLRDKREGYEDIIMESVNYIIAETEHLKNISHGFLDFSNLNELNRERFDLIGLCRGEMNRLEKIFKKIKFALDSGEESVFVNMDKIKIRQVLKNVLSNSVEAIRGRRGIIVLRIIKGKMISLEIEDNGIGLKGLKGKEMFSEDFSSKENGTGLGLFIVKRIVDLHGGSVGIDTSSNGNTVLKIAIPDYRKPGDSKKVKK